VLISLKHKTAVKPMTASGTKETNIKIDWLSTLLVTLLIATLLAFFIGYFPYPYGWIIITLALIARLTVKVEKMTANDPKRTVD
jgi:hypothetical protein